MQVRDVLFVEDLVDAMLLAQQNANRLAGQVFNIGGGPRNTTSLLELLETIHKVSGMRPSVSFQNWRVGDQRYYVSDTRSFENATRWSPKVDVYEGVSRLYSWLLRDKVGDREELRRGVA
jgi:CDP-paratose 2-epimerase